MRVCVLAFFVSCTIAGAAFAVDVTTCGQVVAPTEVGELVGDLDCSGAATGSRAVVLGNRATLKLNGHTITAAPEGFGVSCEAVRRCTISGPGFILGAPPVNTPGVGIASDKNVSVEGSIEIYRHAVGIKADDGKATLSGIILRNNGDGVVAKIVRGEGFFVLNSDRVGITAHKKVYGGPIEIRDSGWAGIETLKFKLDGLNATTNGFSGTTSGGGIMAERRGVLRNSHLSANAFNGAPVDVLTGKEPVMIDSDCSFSAMLVGGVPSGTWGVCTAD
jgi:hypothetical protein